MDFFQRQNCIRGGTPFHFLKENKNKNLEYKICNTLFEIQNTITGIPFGIVGLVLYSKVVWSGFMIYHTYFSCFFLVVTLPMSIEA
jgi:hypothetical protein